MDERDHDGHGQAQRVEAMVITTMMKQMLAAQIHDDGAVTGDALGAAFRGPASCARGIPGCLHPGARVSDCWNRVREGAPRAPRVVVRMKQRNTNVYRNFAPV